jgi:transposase-like protein
MRPIFEKKVAGATIDFLLSELCDADAAKRLFHKSLSDPRRPQPRVINTDQVPIYASAIPDLKKEGALRRRCRHRPRAVPEKTSWNMTIERSTA